MAGGLVGLLDDVAALAKLAAASVDDLGVAAGKASVKAAGVVVDDAAVTPSYVQGLAAERELPIIKRIAMGSLRNKLLFILPAAIILSAISPKLVEIILMCGGAFLCYEGAHKVVHAIKKDDHAHEAPAVVKGTDAEEATIASAIKTDFILSAEIMVISLKEVLDEEWWSRAIILAIVGILITVVVYGVVALIVKMDDVGLSLARRESESSQKLGRGLVAGMPKLLTALSVVGTAAMLWVGGHILVAGAHELGWHTPREIIHDLAHTVHDLGAVSGVLGWFIDTLASAIVGFVVGFVVMTIVPLLPFGKDDAQAEAAGQH
ncbi:MAG: DUF808 domain-containing protein [Acidimicrobiales bacterium]|nr:DUF808 domain-containing protein [Acidimicrobiales bacterium]